MAEKPTAIAAEKLHFPMLPTFDSVEQEREWRKYRLALGFRLFSKAGFDEGTAGHITVRDPEWPDLMWVNGFAVSFSMITPDSLVLVNHDGDVVAGDYNVNRAAFAIHSQVHQARPDVVAAAHSHSVHGKALSSLGVPLRPLTQDACAFYGSHGLMNEFSGVVLDVEEGKKVAHAIGDGKAAILQNHGLITVGHSVESAVWWFMTMERSSQAQLLAMAAGDPIDIDHEMATLTAGQVGSEFAGWFQAQPLFDRIAREVEFSAPPIAGGTLAGVPFKS